MATTQIKNGFQGGSDDQLLVNPDGSINVTPTGGGGLNNVNIYDSNGNPIYSNSEGSLQSNSFPGTPVHLASGQQLTIPGGTTILFNLTNPSTVRKLYLVYVSCSTQGKIEIIQDSILIGSGRTMPGSPNMRFPFTPGQNLTPSVNLTIQISTPAGTAATDVEGYLMAGDL